jgi:hypothetical protein
MWCDTQVSHCLMPSPICDCENYILGHDLFPSDSTLRHTPTHTHVVKPMYWATLLPIHPEAGNCNVHETSVCDAAKPQKQRRQAVYV